MSGNFPEIPDSQVVELLIALRAQHGSLNAALVRLYVAAYGHASILSVAEATGLSRGVVRRALGLVSETDT